MNTSVETPTPCVQVRLYPVVALVCDDIIVILSGANMFFARGKNDLYLYPSWDQQFKKFRLLFLQRER